MDIEKTKKINELISELKKHKNLSGITDPVKKAREILQNEELPEAERGSPGEPEERSLEKIEVMIRESNRAVRNELDLIKKGLLSLNEEFEHLKKEFYEFKNKQGEMQEAEASRGSEEPSQQKKPEEPEKGESRKEEEEEPKQESESSENPRSGEFAEEDVAIDKIFYFGKK